MKFREFVLRDDITQGEYIAFRTGVDARKPSAWAEIEQLPNEVFYDIMVRSAIAAGWVKDVVEVNEYDEETVFKWTEDVVSKAPAGTVPLKDWGQPIFDRWLEYKSIDPN